MYGDSNPKVWKKGFSNWNHRITGKLCASIIPYTNEWGAIEQAIYPSIAPVEMFRIEDCGFSSDIKVMRICINILKRENKMREATLPYISNRDKKNRQEKLITSDATWFLAYLSHPKKTIEQYLK